MNVHDLPKLDDPRLVEHLAMRDAYLAADRPLICPCCGGRANGLLLPYCTDPGWDHFETCQNYRYARDECPTCAADLAAEASA